MFLYFILSANGELFVDTIIEEPIPNRDRNDIDTNVYHHEVPQQPQCGVLYSGMNNNNTAKKSLWSMTRIIGGRPAPKGKWPWQVALLNRYKVCRSFRFVSRILSSMLV